MSKKAALIYGLFWGVMMLLFSVFLNPYLRGETYNFETLPFEIIFWIIGGIGIGFLTRYFQNRSIKKKSNEKSKRIS